MDSVPGMFDSGMTSAASRGVAEQFFDCFARVDVNGMRALLIPDATWWVSGNPDLFNGAGIHQASDIMDLLIITGMDHWSVTVDRIVAEGSNVSVEATGLGRGPGTSVYKAQYSFYFTINGGLIREVREHLDTQSAQHYVDSLPPTQT